LEINKEIKYLIVERTISLALQTNAICSPLFDFPGQNTSATKFDLVLLTRKG